MIFRDMFRDKRNGCVLMIHVVFNESKTCRPRACESSWLVALAGARSPADVSRVTRLEEYAKALAGRGGGNDDLR